MRSFWKGKYFDLFNKVAKSYIRIFNRTSTITKAFVGKRVYVYNGKRFNSFLVRPLMVGLKFGQFSLTKRLGAAIHQTAKNKKKGTK